MLDQDQNYKSKNLLSFNAEILLLPAQKKKFFRKENFVFLMIISLFTLASLFFVFRNFLPVFAVGTFSDDFALLDDAELIANWTLAGAGALKALDADIKVEGSNGIDIYNWRRGFW